MEISKKKELIGHLADNLVMLRSRLDLTQAELAEMIGLSRHTLMAIENKQREMTWSTFLSLVLVFIKNEETNKLLNILEIYTNDLNGMLKGKCYKAEFASKLTAEGTSETRC